MHWFFWFLLALIVLPSFLGTPLWALGQSQNRGPRTTRDRRSRPAHPPFLDERIEDRPRAFDASVTRVAPTHPA